MKMTDITPVPNESSEASEKLIVNLPTARMEPTIPQGSTMIVKFVDVSRLEVGRAYIVNHTVNDYRTPGRLKAIDSNCLTLTFDGYDPDHHIRQHYHPVDIDLEQIKGCFEIIGSMVRHMH